MKLHLKKMDESHTTRERRRFSHLLGTDIKQQYISNLRHIELLRFCTRHTGFQFLENLRQYTSGLYHFHVHTISDVL